GHEVGSAFVTDKVHVLTLIDEGSTRGLDHVRRARGIVAKVKRRGSGRNDDQAGSGVAVPAECPAGHDRVSQDMEVRGSFSVDPGLPVARLRVGIDLVEGANTKYLCCHADRGRCESRHRSGDDLQCYEEWQNSYFFELS